MNTISEAMMIQIMECVGDAIAAMNTIRPYNRPDGYSTAVGRLMFVRDALYNVAVAPVAVEPARDPESVS